MNSPCALSVDLDGEWISASALGRSPAAQDPFFKALPRFLELLGEIRAKCTFFIVGKDLDDPKKRAWIRRAHREGHEIGNHSLAHPPGFSLLSPSKKRGEILDADRRIADALGERPAGFRAPFYDADEETIAILEELGYDYDSSVLPTPTVLFRRLLAAWHYGWSSDRARAIGRAVHALAPSLPYHPAPARLWRAGAASLIEVPIGVTPFSRLPLSSTLHLTTSDLLLPLTFWELARAPRPAHWTFHLRDLVDPLNDGVASALARLPVIGRPLARKERTLARIFASAAARHDFMPIRGYLGALGFKNDAQATAR